MVLTRRAGTGMVALAVALAVAAATSSAGDLAHAKRKHSPSHPVPVRDPCEPLPWTIFQADKEFENLQIHVTGPSFDTLEMYFNRAHKPANHTATRTPAPVQPNPYVGVFWLLPGLQWPPVGVFMTWPVQRVAAAAPAVASTSAPAERFYVDQLAGAWNLHENRSLALAPANEWGTFAVRFGENQDWFKIYGWDSHDEPSMFGPYALMPGYPVCIRWISPRIVKITSGANPTVTLIVRFNPDDTNRWTYHIYP
jgi:hypothetical protein